MTPREFHEAVAQIRSQHMRLDQQLRQTKSKAEKAKIQKQMDAVMIEFRELQRVSLTQFNG